MHEQGVDIGVRIKQLQLGLGHTQALHRHNRRTASNDGGGGGEGSGESVAAIANRVVSSSGCRQSQRGRVSRLGAKVPLWQTSQGSLVVAGAFMKSFDGFIDVNTAL